MPRTAPKTASQTAPTAVPMAETPRPGTRRKAVALVEPVAAAPAADTVVVAAKKAPRRKARAAQPVVAAAAVEATTPAAATAAVEAAMPVPAAAAPAQAPLLKPLAALGVDEGLFVLVAAPLSSGPVEGFARYVESPLPRLVPAAQGSWQKSRTVGNVTVHVAYVPWPQPPAGAVQLGCILAGGRKPVFSVDCLRWGQSEPAPIAALLKRYGTLLVPAIAGTLPASHPLRLALAPARAAAVPARALAAAPAPAAVAAAAPAVAARRAPAVRGAFDGVVDEQAHGWAWAPSDPSRKLTVEVLCGGEVVGRGLADHFRDDLRANGIGEGEHHFRLTLSSELFDGQPHELSVRVVETGTVLSGTAKATLPQRQPVDFDLMPRAQVLDAARQLADKLQVREPKALEALLQAFRTASLQQETGQLAQARAGYERLLKALGANALCQVRIGEAWLLEGALDPAHAAYDAALQLEPGFAWASLGLGSILQRQGRPLEAEKLYRAALEAAPGTGEAKARLGAVGADVALARAQQLQQQGDRQGAIALLTDVLIKQPEHAHASQLLDELLCEPLPEARAPLPEAVANADRARRLLEAVLDEAERRLATVSTATA